MKIIIFNINYIPESSILKLWLYSIVYKRIINILLKKRNGWEIRLSRTLMSYRTLSYINNILRNHWSVIWFWRSSSHRQRFEKFWEYFKALITSFGSFNDFLILRDFLLALFNKASWEVFIFRQTLFKIVNWCHSRIFLRFKVMNFNNWRIKRGMSLIIMILYFEFVGTLLVVIVFPPNYCILGEKLTFFIVFSIILVLIKVILDISFVLNRVIYFIITWCKPSSIANICFPFILLLFICCKIFERKTSCNKWLVLIAFTIIIDIFSAS